MGFNFFTPNILLILLISVIVSSVVLIAISVYFQRKRLKQIYKLPEKVIPLITPVAKETEKVIDIEHPRTILPPVTPIKPAK